MRFHGLVAGALAVAAGVAVGCGSDPVSGSVGQTITLNRVAGGGSVEYSWHAGDQFLEDAGLPGPDVATAANGERMEIRATGAFSLHPKSVSGDGTFTHKDAAGNVLGSGTFAATRLLSFQSYGPSPEFPEDFEAGKAIFRVHLTPLGGGPGFDATLWVGCVLPGGTEDDPGGAFEGSKIAIDGVGNFNRIPVFSPTLFIRQ